MVTRPPNFTDQQHLREHSYQTQEKLNIRIRTHKCYTQPQIEFTRWVLDSIPWLGTETVVDVGCGSGAYGKLARAYGRQYIAGDLSLGMLQGMAEPGQIRVNLDAQHLPFASQTADVVLANHMIYHIPDKDAALAEIARVLRPDGRLIAATNSAHNMAELRRLPTLALQSLGVPVRNIYHSMDEGFSLENGRQLLEKHFIRVTRADLQTALVFPAAQPVLDYINSGRDWLSTRLPAGITWEMLMDAMRQILAQHIARHDEFRVNKLAGVFVCAR